MDVSYYLLLKYRKICGRIPKTKNQGKSKKNHIVLNKLE